MIPNKKVLDLMSTDLKTLEIPGNRETLLSAIKEFRLSVFPVIEKDSDNKLVGMVGRSEILRKPAETQLALLMSKISDWPTIKKEQSIVDLIKLMNDMKRSKIPVIEGDNKIVGLVSISDIIWKIISNDKSFNEEIKENFSDNISVLWEGTPANVAAQILLHSGQEALPVINEKGLAGIISPNDFLKFADVRNFQEISTDAEVDATETWDSSSVLIISDKILIIPSRPVIEIMSKNLHTVTVFSNLSSASQMFRSKKIDQAPVVDEDDHLLGLLTNWDILGAFIKHIS
ncbi:MAG: Inosine-5'-monophosphate dehydrogenase [Candidatus Heimdallarchaeota archaeon LC_3]|nr:MAG: Inosine-5'-monophosphate dehydrogenase [Candidatus Heimdallarchaeota archaeon LC_3]